MRHNEFILEAVEIISWDKFCFMWRCVGVMMQVDRSLNLAKIGQSLIMERLSKPTTFVQVPEDKVHVTETRFIDTRYSQECQVDKKAETETLTTKYPWMKPQDDEEVVVVKETKIVFPKTKKKVKK